jgi:hypothetical protein
MSFYQCLRFEQYNAFLKSDVDSFIEFHDSHDYKKLMQKLKKRIPDLIQIRLTGLVTFPAGANIKRWRSGTGEYMKKMMMLFIQS